MFAKKLNHTLLVMWTMTAFLYSSIDRIGNKMTFGHLKLETPALGNKEFIFV